MGKKLRGLLMLAVVAVFALGVMSNSYGNPGTITDQEIESSSTKKNRESIAETVLTDTGRTDQFTPQEATNIIIRVGNLLGNGKTQIVIDVEFGPKDSIVAVYQPGENGNEYVGEIGRFAYIRNFQFMPIENLDRDVLILREYADQDIGAFEQSSFLKGYLWKDGEFDQVLNVPEGIQAVWNTALDGENTGGKNYWRRVEERTDIEYKDEPTTRLNLMHYQAYRTADGEPQKEVPNVLAYQTIKNRVLTEVYFWSPEWMRFILAQAIDTRTGETVAVLEDFGASPYALLDEYGEKNANLMRILKKNGTTELVDRSVLTDTQGAPTASLYTTY